MGIHFTLGNGAPGGLLGNLPYQDRLKLAHAGDANADWGTVGDTAQADLSLLGPNYGGTPHSIFGPGELDAINAGSMATNAASRASQPLVATNGASLLTPREQAAGYALDEEGQMVGGPPQTFSAPLTFSAPQASFDAPAAPDAPTTNPSAFTTAAAAGASPPSMPSASASPLTQTSTATAMPSSYTLPGYIGQYANTSPGSVSGSPGGTGSGTPYGRVPTVPDPILSADQAISGNLANLGKLYQLGGSLNDFNQSELIDQYENALPGYGGMVGQSSRNIASKLAGVVPTDVLEQLQQGAAERGIGSGSYLDDNQSAAYLKALGLTSLDLQNQGESELTNAIKRTPTAQLFNPGSFLVSPEDMQASNWAANQFAAAPDPTLAAQEAERRALAGINAGKAAAGGGGSTMLPSGGLGAVNPVSGTAFNPFSGGGSLPTGLGGRTNAGSSALSEDQKLVNWWENMFGEGSYWDDMTAPQTTTGNSQDDQLATWWDNNFGEGTWAEDMGAPQTGSTGDDQLSAWWDNTFGEGTWDSDMYGDGY